MKSLVGIAPEAALEDLQIANLTTVEEERPDIELGAVIPDITTWRPIDDARLESVLAGADTPNAAAIELVTPPQPLMEAVHLHRRQHGGSPEARHAGKEILERVGIEYDAEYLFMHDAPTNALATTVNPATGKACGLHLDNRDNLPISERLLRSRRRLAVNAGRVRRWLHAVFPDIVTMSLVLGNDETHVPTYQDFRDFIAKYPEEAFCVRVPIPPGMAHLTPTDGIVHDGAVEIIQNGGAYYFLGDWVRQSFIWNSEMETYIRSHRIPSFPRAMLSVERRQGRAEKVVRQWAA